MTTRFTSAREFVDLVTQHGMTGGLAAKKALREATEGRGYDVLSQLVQTHVGSDAQSLKNAANYAELLAAVMGEITTGESPEPYDKALTEFLDKHGFLAAPIAKNDAPQQSADSHVANTSDTPAEGDQVDAMDALDSLLAGDEFDLPAADDPKSQTVHSDISATTPAKKQVESTPEPASDAGNSPKNPSFLAEPDGTVAEAETNTFHFDPLTELGDQMYEKQWEGSAKTGQARIASGELMKLPGILPPPPKNGSPESYGAWLEGDIWNPLAMSIKLALKDSDNLDDLIEMQSEFYALPESAVQTYGARNPADPETGRKHAEFIHYAARDLGQVFHSYDKGHEMLAKAVARYFEEREPKSADFLARVGYSFKCDTPLVDTVCGALDMERFFINNGPADAGRGPLSDLRGAISSAARLDVPYMLDRAVLLHFGSGVSLATGLHDTLIELRHAQLSRHLGRDVSPFEFDPAFKRDWFTELDEYEMSREEDHMPSPM